MVEGITLERRQTGRHLAERKLGGALGRRSVPAAVAPDLVAHLAAQQLVDGHAQRLALDVVEGHLDTGRGAVLDRTAACEVVVVHRLPELFDAEGVLADDQLAKLLDHRNDSHRATGRVAPADNALVSLNLDKDKVPGREVEHRVNGDAGRGRDGADLGDFHGTVFLCVSSEGRLAISCSLLSEAIAKPHISPLPPMRGRCRRQRGGSLSQGLSGRWRRTPPLSLRDISPRKGGRGES